MPCRNLADSLLAAPTGFEFRIWNFFWGVCARLRETIFRNAKAGKDL
jgi:hypothetical protein